VGVGVGVGLGVGVWVGGEIVGVCVSVTVGDEIISDEEFWPGWQLERTNNIKTSKTRQLFFMSSPKSTL
jgi:hypothetical protein